MIIVNKMSSVVLVVDNRWQRYDYFSNWQRNRTENNYLARINQLISFSLQIILRIAWRFGE